MYTVGTINLGNQYSLKFYNIHLHKLSGGPVPKLKPPVNIFISKRNAKREVRTLLTPEFRYAIRILL